MAGDWIKFEHSTLDKPEVLVLADYMETNADDVVGKLLRVWVWFDKNSVNGDAGGVTGSALMRFIDAHVGRNGFAACMKKVGWLTEDGLPNFDRHNGETAKKRALSKDRMRKKRYADVTPEASLEKRREEKKETTKANAFALPDWVPAESWNGWLEVRAKNKAPNTTRALKLALADLTKLRGQGHDPAAILDTATARGWKGLFAPREQPAKAADPFAGMLNG